MLRSISIIHDDNNTTTAEAERFAIALGRSIPKPEAMAVLNSAAEVYHREDQAAAVAFDKAAKSAGEQFERERKIADDQLKTAEARISSRVPSANATVANPNAVDMEKADALTKHAAAMRAAQMAFNHAQTDARGARNRATRASMEAYLEECASVGIEMLQNAISVINRGE